jgi:hypothetical protein
VRRPRNREVGQVGQAQGNSRVLTKICMVAKLKLDSVNAVERVWEGGKVEEQITRGEREGEGESRFMYRRGQRALVRQSDARWPVACARRCRM